MEKQSPEEITKWDRWFAGEANNLAWTLAENPHRTASEREEMLRAAHAAAWHWSRIGTELHQARADLLLGLAYALAGHGSLAMTYARRSYDYLTSHQSPDWEIALAHAVLAHAACAAQEKALHATHYASARSLGEAIADPEEREIFRRTFDQLPTP